MGKKDAKIMAEQKKLFIEGAIKLKVEKKTAEHIFDLIETFARYGFNRAHSTCYALIAYQTAWLKIHYPHEFMAAIMTSEMHDSDRVVVMMEECRRMGIEVLPPDVNDSQGSFTVVGDKIRFGLLAIKNVGSGPVEQLIKAREKDGKFKSLAEFVSQVDLHAVNKRALESMIKAGAFDTIHDNRRAMYESLEQMVSFGQTIQQDDHTVDMFGSGQSDQTRRAPEMPSVADWSLSTRLSGEKEMLGFYVSGHPLANYRGELKQFASITSHKISSADDGREVHLGGIIQNVKVMLDKRGNQMAFVTIEDFAGSLELIVFSDCFERAKDYLVVDGIILTSGRVSTREGQAPKLIVSSIVPFNRLSEFFNCRLVLKMDKKDYQQMAQLLPILEAHRGEKELLILTRINGEELTIRPKNLRVDLSGNVINDVKKVLGDTGAYLAPA
jgi:DNA polymerase-3 subunit alpha